MNRLNAIAALAAATVIGGGLGLAPVPAHGADKPMVSRAFGKPLKAADDDVKKGDYQAALAELAKARALPMPTPYDTHVINELSWFAYYRTKDLRDAAKSMEATLDDGFTSVDKQHERIQDIAVFYYQLNDFAKAAEFGERAIKGGFATANTDLLVSQAYYQEHDFRNALRVTELIVNNEMKRGETPKESQLQIILDSCVKLSDNSCISRALERLVTYYPKPDYWQDLMTSLFQSRQAESSDVDMLNIYRLAMDVGAMTMPSQYIEMAQLALEQGSPGDAEQVLQQGYGKNVFTDQHDREHASRLFANAKKLAASDQSTLPKLATEASASPTGDKDVAVGLAYLGYQQYDKAADALAEGLMKGGVRNQAQAQLLLGIAELKAGRKADAVKAFHAVMGDPTLVRLAALWSLRAHGPAGTLASR
jgi:tetratricopeptide (TPR) repeat protein